jgi:hypothetical protein
LYLLILYKRAERGKSLDPLNNFKEQPSPVNGAANQKRKK